MRDFRLPLIPHMQGHIIQEEIGQQVGVCACVRVSTRSLRGQAMAEASWMDRGRRDS